MNRVSLSNRDWREERMIREYDFVIHAAKSTHRESAGRGREITKPWRIPLHHQQERLIEL